MTMNLRRSRSLPGVVLVALSALSAAQATPPETIAAAATVTVIGATSKPPVRLTRRQFDVSRPRGFYETFLAPGMSTVVRGEHAVTLEDGANSWSNRGTQDPGAAGRVETRAIRALAKGVKRYAIERLAADGFSLPVLLGRTHDGAALPDDTRGARLHLGFSSLAPRADLLIPVNAGRVVVSADARLRVSTTFESAAFGFRLAASIDIPERTAVMGLNLRF